MTVQQAQRTSHTDLRRRDLSTPGCGVIQHRVEVGPGAPPGSGDAVELATYLVEKGKPLLVVVE